MTNELNPFRISQNDADAFEDAIEQQVYEILNARGITDIETPASEVAYNSVYSRVLLTAMQQIIPNQEIRILWTENWDSSDIKKDGTYSSTFDI